MTLLKFQNVSFLSERKTILHNLSLDIEEGCFISIVGPSGSGKSTFLKLCCHLLSPSEGKITFRDKDIREYNPTELRRRIGYCFQTPYLFGETVEDDMSFPYAIRNQELNLDRVYRLFADFNLPREMLTQDIHTLSGGEKQRIALVRTLLYQPEILLLDEVTSSLDAENALQVEAAINSLNQEGTTILWVTHDPRQNKNNAHMLLTIADGGIKSQEEVK